MTVSADKKAKQFLKQAKNFQLGKLPTEARHTQTLELSKWAKKDLLKAIRILKKIDLHAIESIKNKLPEILEMAKAIDHTLKKRHRVFLCGCGATGRLAINLEYLWRKENLNKPARNSVISFMAGGDVALIHSIENFEDHPEFGVKQLMEAGFKKNDLLISCTEGGETPFVIGATEKAARYSLQKPYFLYCNPDTVLAKTAKRSERILNNPKIRKINLFVGPMSLSGSTRLQASTVLMLAVGYALFYHRNPSLISIELTRLLDWIKKTPFKFLKRTIEKEAAIFNQGNGVIYNTREYGVTVLTDTTERSPTFSLTPFENRLTPSAPASLCYLCLPNTRHSAQAWGKLLLRPPNTLAWKKTAHLTGKIRLLGFDLSANVRSNRIKKQPSTKQYTFEIDSKKNKMIFRLENIQHQVLVNRHSLLHQHILLKILLNIHSTLVMGKLGRYEGNLMTWVKSSNNKLVDRAIRYIRFLFFQKTGKKVGYREVAFQLFNELEKLEPHEPIVVKTLNALLRS